MELLDRYLHAVKFWLPKAQQEDIIKELSDNILSQMEDKESELGRPLTEAEQSTILKHHGHPMMAASRYWPRQHLIGPAVFPVYWFVLKVSVVLAVVMSLASGLAVLTSAKPAQEMAGALLSKVFLDVPGVAVITFAWVTAVFAALDYGQSKLHRLDKWDPTSLPRIDKRKSAKTPVKPICELIASAVFVLWWLAVPQFPFLVFGPAHSFLRLSPALESFHVTILLLLLVPVALHIVAVLRPSPDWLLPLTALISRIVTLTIIGVLLKAGSLVIVTADAPSHLSVIAAGVNVYLSLTLSVASVIVALQILMTVVRLIRGEGRLLALIS
jgi:hypothetical protein